MGRRKKGMGTEKPKIWARERLRYYGQGKTKILYGQGNAPRYKKGKAQSKVNMFSPH